MFYCLIRFLTKFGVSRHFQVAIYAVFHVEFESAVKNKQFLQPGWKIEEKLIKK